MGEIVYIVINSGKIKLVTRDFEKAVEKKESEINNYYSAGGTMAHKVILEEHLIK